MKKLMAIMCLMALTMGLTSCLGGSEDKKEEKELPTLEYIAPCVQWGADYVTVDNYQQKLSGWVLATGDKVFDFYYVNQSKLMVMFYKFDKEEGTDVRKLTTTRVLYPYFDPANLNRLTAAVCKTYGVTFKEAEKDESGAYRYRATRDVNGRNSNIDIVWHEYLGMMYVEISAAKDEGNKGDDKDKPLDSDNAK